MKIKTLTYILLLIPVIMKGSTRVKMPEVIKQFPLDERSVYKINIGTEAPTTVMFPGPVEAISGANICIKHGDMADVMLSYTENKNFFHVRAMSIEAEAAANVIYKNKTYVLMFCGNQQPFRSVNFYETSSRMGDHSNNSVMPERLLELLDKAKMHRFFEMQYPEMVQQVERAFPMTVTLYKNFEVWLEEVIRFDPEDTLIFRIKLKNKTDQEIYYQPQRLAVRIGDNVYYASIADASGILPACSEVYGYFAITGKPSGARANLSVKNNFSIIVTQVEDASMILLMPTC